MADEDKGSERLPSFQGPRDLKLSLPPARIATPSRRTFTPNVASGKNRAPPKTGESSSSSSGGRGDGGGGDRPHQSKRGREGGFRPNVRGRGRGDNRRKDGGGMIQMEGVFAGGVGSETLTSKYRAPAATGASGGGGSRRLTASSHSMKKVDKSEIKKESYSPFISDLGQGGDDVMEPVTIPLSSYAAAKPVKEGYESSSEASFTSFARLLEEAPEDGTVVLFQLPEHLPLLLDKEEVKEVSLSSGISQFPEGLLGATNVLSSGLSKLTIGDNQFNIQEGTDSPFYQELVLATDDSFISLGPIRHKFLCTSDVDSFLSQS